MRILISILVIFNYNAFASLNNNIKNIVERCTISIVSSNQDSFDRSLFHKKDLSKNIEQNISYGTGFIYYPQKNQTPLILTNFHVIKQPLREKQKIFGCNTLSCFEISVKMVDKNLDLAMLSATEDFECQNDIILKDDGVSSSSQIFIYGNKFGLDNSFAFGYLAANERDISKSEKVHLLDINAGEGNSRSPIFLNNSTYAIGMLKNIYSIGGSSSIAIGIIAKDIKSSIEKMEHILNFQKYLEFNIVENESGIYFIRNNDNNIFFTNFNLTPSDQVQNIDSKVVTNTIDALYNIYEFISDQNRQDIKIVFITEKGELKDTILTKYRGNTENTVISESAK